MQKSIMSMARASWPDPIGTSLAKFRPTLLTLRWSRSYNRKWLGMGLTAGLTLAALTIHEGLAYAALAGLSPEMGSLRYHDSCVHPYLNRGLQATARGTDLISLYSDGGQALKSRFKSISMFGCCNIHGPFSRAHRHRNLSISTRLSLEAYLKHGSYLLASQLVLLSTSPPARWPHCLNFKRRRRVYREDIELDISC